MNESFVDLTYRGLSLGRRIKLTQVRPSSGYLELPSPMPVGTHVAIATDDGVQLDATVAWVHEQVAGADRPPGMVVLPDLGAEPAAAWWKARVALPDDEAPRPRRPTRPVTVRPRSHTRPTTPPAVPAGVITDDRAAIKADLDARVAAAAGTAPVAATPSTAPTVVDPSPFGHEPAGIEGRAATDEDEPEMTVSTDEESQPHALPTPGSAPGNPRDSLRDTGEHAVVDDGAATTIMQSVDPEALGLETGMSGEFTLPGVTIPGPPRGNGGEIGDDDGGPTDPGVGPGRDRR